MKKPANPAPRNLAAPTPNGSALGLERLVFFSDAVMAIAMTLLAADLRVPQLDPSAAAAELPFALSSAQPQIISFVISFVVIGIYWLSHHRTFGYIQRYDARLATLNMIFLFFIVCMPFLARLLGEYAYLPLSIATYSLAVAGIALSQLGVWHYATRHHRLVDPSLDRTEIAAGYVRNIAGALLFLVAAPIAFVSIAASFALWWLSPLVSIIAVRRLSRRPALS